RSAPFSRPGNTDLILRSLPTGRANARPMTGSASVSKDGYNARTRGHPSRRAQGRAPQDEVGDIFTRSFAGTTSWKNSPLRRQRVGKAPGMAERINDAGIARAPERIPRRHRHGGAGIRRALDRRVAILDLQ